MDGEKKGSTDNIEIRLSLDNGEQEKLEYIKQYLKKKKNTSVFYLLLDEKYQEIKKLKLSEE